MSAGPLHSMPGLYLLRSDTVGHVTPETATEQSILEIAKLRT